jgi:hypothetical protein
MADKSKIEHLKFVQKAISRMASNEFMLKGWTVTLVAALLALGAKDSDHALVIIAWIPVLVFTGLSAYYLQLERMFRRLHTKVATKPDTDPVDFSMDISEFRDQESLRKALISKSIVYFYAPIALLLGLLTLYFALLPKAVVTPVQGPRTITISIQ